MAKYRKKPVVIDAAQWHKIGDHSAVRSLELTAWQKSHHESLHETCHGCGRSDYEKSHGHVGTLEGGHIVCPGDWIITGVKGENYPCKPDIFEQTYELAEPPQAKEVKDES